MHGDWTDWESWGACSVTCDVGLQKRSRTCADPTPEKHGQHCFGESTVQDAQNKQVLIDDPANEWHFIGHLQTNKTKLVPGHFDWLHTLDSLRLARRLSDQALNSASTLNVLLQVNIASDPDKFGLPPAEVSRFVDELLQSDLAGIRLERPWAHND